MVESDYRGHRIEVVAVHVDGAWDAELGIRLTSSPMTTACAGYLSCRTPTALTAEQRGAASARQWTNRYGAVTGDLRHARVDSEIGGRYCDDELVLSLKTASMSDRQLKEVGRLRQSHAKGRTQNDIAAIRKQRKQKQPVVNQADVS